jgi:hypothetical protein
MPAVSTKLPSPHSASAEALRFCHQATRSTTPAQADAKLPIIIKVGRSSRTMLSGPGSTFSLLGFCEAVRGRTGGAFRLRRCSPRGHR